MTNAVLHTPGNSTLAVGCDIGGTRCKVGVTDCDGTVLDHAAFSIPDPPSLNSFCDELYATLNLMVRTHRVGGIGVLLPGYLSENRTVPRLMVNLPFLAGAPLARSLAERYGVKVVMDIDRNGPALAEYRYHHLHERVRLLYVTIGTGLGVALVIDGAICRICNDSIGELGHVTLERNGAPCVCGNRGCAETLLSRDGIRRIAMRLKLCGSLRQDHSPQEFPKALYEKAVAGDTEARCVLKEFGRYLGAALVSYANTFSPDVVVLGGGLSGASDFFLPTAERDLNARWIERATKTIQVRRTKFGQHAGVIGAAALVLS